jgi:4-amino-4-deoxy-L-arabinose transferase-like glycosyltransferase
LLSVVPRLVYLSQPMRYDEALTFLQFASKPLSEGLSNYSQPNNHLFHTLLVHISYSLFGDQPWVIRLPALLAGIALVPLVYWVTRQHFNPEAGLLAAGLTGSSSVLIEFSTNARGYTLVCCFFVALLGLGYVLRGSARGSKPLATEKPSPLKGLISSADKRWLVFALLGVLGMYTIPTMLYPLGIVALWLLLSILVEDSGQPRLTLLAYMLSSLLLAAGLTLLLYVPVINVSGMDSLTGNRYVQTLPWQNFVLQIPILLERVWLTWNRDIPLLIQWLLVIGFIVSFIFHQRLACYRIPIVFAMLWLIPVLLVQRVVGFPRTWLFLLPLYFMLASAGMIYLLRAVLDVGRTRGFAPTTELPHLSAKTHEQAQQHEHTWYALFALIVSLVLSVSVLQSQSILASEETGALRGAAAFTELLVDRLQPGDGVLALLPADAPLEYYFRLNGLSASYLNTDLGNKQRLFVVVYKPATTLADTLARAGLPSGDYGAPELVARVEPASLYQIERLGAPAEKRLPVHPQHLIGHGDS